MRKNHGKLPNLWKTTSCGWRWAWIAMCFFGSAKAGLRRDGMEMGVWLILPYFGFFTPPTLCGPGHINAIPPATSLACTHRNFAPRLQTGLSDSSEGSFPSCSEQSVSDYYFYCCGYDSAKSKNQQLFFKSIFGTVLRGRTVE